VSQAIVRCVIGQVLGIGVLTAASALAALAALAVPEAWIALLDLVPLILGVRKLWMLWQRGTAPALAGQPSSHDDDHPLEPRTHSQIVAIAGVTIANGGDTLSVYIPLFASDLQTIVVYAVIFAVMTGVWCAMGYALVNNPLAGSPHSPLRTDGLAIRTHRARPIHPCRRACAVSMNKPSPIATRAGSLRA